MADDVPLTASKTPIRVLVVDDSAAAREFLIYLLASDPEIQVIGTANNGEEALMAVKAKKPDLVTMDIHMPRMNGYEATRAIMETHPVPIVIVTGSLTDAEISSPLAALDAGAVAVLKRPEGMHHPDHANTVRALIQTVKLMSEIKVVRRWAGHKAPHQPNDVTLSTDAFPAREIRLVAIGASTGGPLVLQQILTLLPKKLSAPIIIVQHITEGFTEGFSNWLNNATGFPVNVAEHGEFMKPGHAYVAPDGRHATVNSQGQISLKKGSPEHGHIPSVSCLFRSVAEAYGPKAIGVLLTGMGKDGAEELGAMRDKGAVTLAQDKNTSVVHGMPGEAIRCGAAIYVLSPEKIASAIIAMAKLSTS